jgi:rRNA maturation endonuclease Nob1
MFRVSLTELLSYYLLVLLLLLSLVWGVKMLLAGYRERKSLRYRFRCVICGKNYTDDTELDMVECPQCGRYNERGLVQDI